MQQSKRASKANSFFAARKDYVSEMLDIEKSSPGPTTETIQKLEADASSLDERVKDLEGNMLELLPCPVPLCAHNFKYNKNAKKRSAGHIIRPSKLTAKINKNSNLDIEQFKIPRKTVRSNNVPKEDPKITATNNKFAVLNTANDDVGDVTQRTKIKGLWR
ncbi:hypothetical protein TNIN_338241 [Trichonephila inaurata madagascariensis]|uniref:Uncharacterized protein n=1 Tax=Trichonephila inaurata madagascariensis TaxID=2747483 RepID=A0A8X6IYV6_9ARAC|nr:hypothetical protein TNIN_338241 [Trichonephila inaurata madagascariensis]